LIQILGRGRGESTHCLNLKSKTKHQQRKGKHRNGIFILNQKKILIWK